MSNYDEKLQEEKERLLNELGISNMGSDKYKETFKMYQSLALISEQEAKNERSLREIALDERKLDFEIEKQKSDREIELEKIRADIANSRRLFYGTIGRILVDFGLGVSGGFFYLGLNAQNQEYEDKGVMASTSLKESFRKGASEATRLMHGK